MPERSPTMASMASRARATSRSGRTGCHCREATTDRAEAERLMPRALGRVACSRRTATRPGPRPGGRTGRVTLALGADRPGVVAGAVGVDRLFGAAVCVHLARVLVAGSVDVRTETVRLRATR